MAEVKIILTAEDQTKTTFSAVAASAKSAFSTIGDSANSAFSNIGDSAKTAFSSLSNAVQSVGSKIASVFKSIQANWLAVAGVIGSMMFLKNMAASAYEAELAFNRLKIQIEGLGIAYGSVAPQVNAAIQATAKYAIIQEEEVAGVLQKLIFYSGDLDESMKRLNLTFDFAQQKGIDVSSAADLIGKAMSGNVEMLGRYVPELRNLEETLGKNATEAEKTAYTFAVLEEKSANALANMTEHEKTVRELTKVWRDFSQFVGGVIIFVLDGLVQGFMELRVNILEAATAATWLTDKLHITSGMYAAMSTEVEKAKQELQDYTNKTQSASQATEGGISALKEARDQIAQEAKARSDSIETIKTSIKELEKYSDVIKSLGAEALKFAETDFTKNMKLPGEQISEMQKAIADTEKMLAESSKLLSIEGVMENNSAAVRRHYELQKTYITVTNTLREKEQNALGSLKTAMEDYGSAIDAVYGNQLAKQAAIKTQLEQQKSQAAPKDISAAAEAIAKQSVLILETEKKQAEARLGLWQGYYNSVASLHAQAVEAQKQKTLELIALESQIAAQRQGFDAIQKSLAAKAQPVPQVPKITQYYQEQARLEQQLASAVQLTGQARIDSLTKYQDAAAKAVDILGKNSLGKQAAAIALEQTSEAQKSIETASAALVTAKQNEITKTQEAAAATKTAMLDAQTMTGQYETQIIALANQMSALKLSVDNSGALSAIADVQAQINAIPAVTYKKIVYEITGKGSAEKPISEKIADIITMFSSIENLRPLVTADFSSVTGEMLGIIDQIPSLNTAGAISAATGVGFGYQSERLAAGLKDMLSGINSVAQNINDNTDDLQTSVIEMTKASLGVSWSVNEMSQILNSQTELQSLQFAKSIIDQISSLNISAASSAATGVGLGYQSERLAAGATIANAQLQGIQLYTNFFQALFGNAEWLIDLFKNMPQYTSAYVPYTSTSSFASGTPYVPRDMIARIHKGEAIVPARYNPYSQVTRDERRETIDASIVPRPSSSESGKSEIHIHLGEIKIIAAGSDTPAALAKKLVKPIKEELRRLAQLQ